MTYKIAFKYNQDNQEYLSLILSLEDILKISKVLVYGGEDGYGYQRALNKMHYTKIKKSILSRKVVSNKPIDLISPTSIVLGINESDFFKIQRKEEEDNLIKVDLSNANKVFRIIDGQHRIEGFKLAQEEEFELKDYLFNVIVIIVKDDKRIVEVNTFSDINSKSKPLKGDLTILAKYNYELLEEVEHIELEKHIAIKIAFALNGLHTNTQNVWENGIKLDVNTPSSLGIIGFKSFYESIKPICTKYVHKYHFNIDKEFKTKSFKEMIELIDIISNDIIDLILLPYWNIIKYKWSECFTKNLTFYNYDEYYTYFNKNYYIQKTMGTKSLHILLREYLDENEYNIKESMRKLELTINNSKITVGDWEAGGMFSGLSSEAGFRKIASIIDSE